MIKCCYTTNIRGIYMIRFISKEKFVDMSKTSRRHIQLNQFILGT